MPETTIPTMPPAAGANEVPTKRYGVSNSGTYGFAMETDDRAAAERCAAEIGGYLVERPGDVIEPVRYTLTVVVPVDERDHFLAAVTGRDDDVVLAAEAAIRRRVDDQMIDTLPDDQMDRPSSRITVESPAGLRR